MRFTNFVKCKIWFLVMGSMQHQYCICSNLGDFCHVSTGAIVNGGAVIGNNVFIGSNAVVINGRYFTT